MKQAIVFTAAGCLAAGLAFAAIDANAAIGPLPAGNVYGERVASAGSFTAAPHATSGATGDAVPIILARRGADDPAGDQRRGRGTDNVVQSTGQGLDNSAGHQRRGRGTDNLVQPAGQGAGNPAGHQRRGRGTDDAVTPTGQGADNPPGDLRHGRGRDDPPGHQ